MKRKMDNRSNIRQIDEQFKQKLKFLERRYEDDSDQDLCPQRREAYFDESRSSDQRNNTESNQFSPRQLLTTSINMRDQRLEFEKTNLFIPSGKTKADYTKCTGRSKENQHDPLEEGIADKTSYFIETTMMNKMSNRLAEIKSEARRHKLFNACNGDIVRNPCSFCISEGVFTIPDSKVESFIKPHYYKAKKIHRNDNKHLNVICNPTTLANYKAKKFRIDLSLKEFEIFYHPLWSEEHILMAQLKKLFNKYEIKKDNNFVKPLYEQIQAIKSTISFLQNSIVNRTLLSGDITKSDILYEIKCYIDKLRSIRGQLDTELSDEIKTQTDLLSKWKKILALREKQGFTCTPVHLKVTKVDVNLNKDKQILEQQINEELTELKYYNEFHGKDFNPEIELKKLNDKYCQIRRKPGQAKLNMYLRFDAHVSDNSECTAHEMKRRERMNHTKLSMVVKFNNKVVGQTQSFDIPEENVVKIDEVFFIYIVEYPEDIVINLNETYTLKESHKTTIATVQLCAPQLQKIQTTTNFKIRSTSTRRKSSSLFEDDHSTEVNTTQSILDMDAHGTLLYSIEWGRSKDGKLLCPQSSIEECKSKQMFSCFRENEYPTFRCDECSVESFGDHFDVKLKKRKQFQLNPRCVLQLMPKLDLWQSKRFAVLEIQNQMRPFVNMNLYPMKDSEVTPELVEMLMDANSLSCKDNSKQENSIVDPCFSRCADLIKTKMGRSNLAQRKYTSKCLINFRRRHCLSHRIIDILDATRCCDFRKTEPLALCNIDLSSIPGYNDNLYKHHIYVKLIEAVNLPIHSLTRNPKYLIELNFQNIIYRSSIAVGPNPTWNDEYALPVKIFGLINQEYGINELCINLYEAEEKECTQNNCEGCAGIIRIEIIRHWLGSISIPYSTLESTSLIKGAFQLMQPVLSILNYTHHNPSDSCYDNSKHRIKLNLLIALMPDHCVYKSLQLTDQMCSDQPSELLKRARKWRKQIEASYFLLPFVYDSSDGSCKLACSFIQAILPPTSLLANAGDMSFITSEKLARYVSLIPFFYDSYSGYIWTLSNKMLDNHVGDTFDHALLLLNYFLAIGKKAWIVVGFSVPVGISAKVLTIEHMPFAFGYVIWDTVTGQWESTTNKDSQMQTIDIVINNENIWGSRQKFRKPCELDFDFDNKKKWKPLLSLKYSSHCVMLQTVSYDYGKIKSNNAISIEKTIEETARQSFIRWRGEWTTRFDDDHGKLLRHILIKLEKARRHGNATEESLIYSRANHIRGKYQNVIGHIVNIPFNSVQECMTPIKSMQLHQFCNDTEFALAVYVYPFPNQTYSVWIYVMILR
ncbi:hypothetical protein GJ496_006756 [Pomphorhynchus laevis]|nr:hypothetical protein GJ496_006756 [Pomphorhynchus laevis]